MKVKVCGMRDPENILEILKEGPDFIGFIFYDESKRFVNDQTLDYLRATKIETKKVGVFVNHDVQDLESIVNNYDLDFVQLHGNESPEYLRSIQGFDASIIKAFNVDESFDWNTLNAYDDLVEFFLFDTACSTYGGSGKKFNWDLIENYKLNTPFFLSGGISIEDVGQLKSLTAFKPHALDINSRFEIEPGIKDTTLVSEFLNKIRNAELSS